MKRLAILLVLPLAMSLAGETAPLHVGRVRMRIKGAGRSERPRDSLHLIVRVRPTDVPLDYGPANDGLSVGVGSRTLEFLPPLPERTRLRSANGRCWRYREKGRASYRLDLDRGKLVLKARGLDLSDAVTGSGREVPVVLVLGDQSFSATVDLVEKGNGWSYRAPRSIPFFEPMDPGPPGDPGPDPGPGFRVLLEGAASDVTTPQNVVFRTRTSYEDFWFGHPGMWPPSGGAPITPPPDVDFTSEMVVGSFLGAVPSATYALHVIAVRVEGTTLVVVYQEEQPGPGCPIPMLIGPPFVLAAVPRTSGSVTFERTVWVKQCP